ncbi:chorion transcription factor Cf2-like isoform X2 [Portunus trituberculatus]|uniref:chorion transcription factor Cf2-like isoform X2 n=1 Tax=Portunus trituberculatus TaxID=210409 RepID=UPI001E1CD110|nr:chorion transcription factor Cf2-like isoform X2 [Portunus trituberculatus]
MADGLLSLSWNNHMSTFSHMLSDVRDVARYTDVTLACDGKFYPAHKLVLSTCSDYFLKMFEITSCKHPVIIIRDVKSKNMEALLNYMYAGVVNVSQSDLPQLIKAAELLEIKGLAVADEPPSDSKRPAQTIDTPVDRSSPNPKRPKQDEKRLPDQAEMLINSPTPPQSSPLRKDDNLDEQANAHDVYENVNQKQIQSELNQDRKDTSCSRSEQLDSEHGSDQLILARVASEIGIKEEKIDLENEKEAADMGYEYDSLMTDLIGEEGGGPKEHSASMEPFNHSLNEESYSSEAGPSGLQVWPVLGEGAESAGQGYTGGLPVGNHSGLQSLQMDHMMRKVTDGEHTVRGQVLGEMNNFATPYKRYLCSFCDYATNNATCHKRHVRTHTGEKPFHCPYCPAKCTRKATLLAHIQCHTGETPLMCSHCPYVSRQKSNLNRHIKRYHRNL